MFDHLFYYMSLFYYFIKNLDDFIFYLILSRLFF